MHATSWRIKALWWLSVALIVSLHSWHKSKVTLICSYMYRASTSLKWPLGRSQMYLNREFWAEKILISPWRYAFDHQLRKYNISPMQPKFRDFIISDKVKLYALIRGGCRIIERQGSNLLRFHAKRMAGCSIGLNVKKPTSWAKKGRGSKSRGPLRPIHYCSFQTNLETIIKTVSCTSSPLYTSDVFCIA